MHLTRGQSGFATAALVLVAALAATAFGGVAAGTGRGARPRPSRPARRVARPTLRSMKAVESIGLLALAALGVFGLTRAIMGYADLLTVLAATSGSTFFTIHVGWAWLRRRSANRSANPS